MTKASLRALLKALDEKRTRDGLTWESIAKDLSVTERTLYNAMAWGRGEGKHEPSRDTSRTIAKWLRERGVFVATS